MRRLRVLITEGKRLAAARLTAQLANLGHEVLPVAPDGPTAVTAARRLRPDLVLLTMQLPRMDSIQTASTILSRQVLPIILLSGYLSADLVQHAQEAGILTSLTIPTDARELARGIDLTLARFQELRIIRGEAVDLQDALRIRTLVQQAKKVLMRRLECSEAEAFQRLRRHGRGVVTPVANAAANVLAADDLLFGQPGVVRCLRIILTALARSEERVTAPVA